MDILQIDEYPLPKLAEEEEAVGIITMEDVTKSFYRRRSLMRQTITTRIHNIDCPISWQRLLPTDIILKKFLALKEYPLAVEVIFLLGRNFMWISRTLLWDLCKFRKMKLCF
ncbi:hypothetical protein GIB67_041298 [Kingdonia uniflora]|uniref:CBS domain-containing protein n=1 Tax=Kingdonia uniflora TaxID=39325 RepID=A0A7J7NIX5_9MAGN|nr:hypothetical protein GIB67_041298 [Kingdonia uniflora]